LGVLAAAVTGRGKRNGQWHSHKKERGARESVIATEISRVAPEPYSGVVGERALNQLVVGSIRARPTN
jgi:hypothetical protein